MFRFFFRLIGLWLIAAAIVALVVDGTKSIAASSFVFTPTGASLHWLMPNLLIGLKSVTQNHIHPILWDPVMQSILLLPTWSVAAVVGLLLYLAGRRRRGPQKRFA